VSARCFSESIEMQLGPLVLIWLCFLMFFLVYIILMGGSDFHERDFIGYLFNKVMGGLGGLLCIKHIQPEFT
jgi:hypothetical protein